MPLQNRVDPWGKLHEIAARGAWLGNRGILHNDKKQVIAQWRHPNWVTCRLEFKDRRREIFSPKNYSELFFLDEATAFSAGHRPCAECRNARYKEFKKYWCMANAAHTNKSNPSADEIDKLLHTERVVSGGAKVVFETEFETLPDGTFIELNGQALLCLAKRMHVWSATGYRPLKESVASSQIVTVLTPASIVRTFNLGFRPQIHESAYNQGGCE